VDVGSTVRAIMWWAGVAVLGIAAASALTLGIIWAVQDVARPLAAMLMAVALPALVLYARLLVREWRTAAIEPEPQPVKPKRPARRTPAPPVADEDLAGISLWDIPAQLPRGGSSAR
jgi:hypothetical protein